MNFTKTNIVCLTTFFLVVVCVGYVHFPFLMERLGVDTSTVVECGKNMDATNQSIENIKVSVGLSDIDTPDGWEVYVDNEWGIAFAYPGDWDFNSSYHRVSLRGDGYDISLSSGDRGLRDTDWVHPSYIIGGEEAETWQSERVGQEDGYEQIIRITYQPQVLPFIFHIYTPNKVKKISDEILSTVIFLK